MNDSWEKIIKDAQLSDCNYWCVDEDQCDECPVHVEGSISSCWGKKEEDIVRRCKALAGVE